MGEPAVRKLNLSRLGIVANPEAGKATGNAFDTYGDLWLQSRRSEPNEQRSSSQVKPTPSDDVPRRRELADSSVRRGHVGSFGSLDSIQPVAPVAFEREKSAKIKQSQQAKYDLLRPDHSVRARPEAVAQSVSSRAVPAVPKDSMQNLLQGPTAHVEAPRRVIRSVQERREQKIPFTELGELNLTIDFDR